MKTLLAFIYFFGSILIIIGLLWLGVFLTPPEFVLDRKVLTVERGTPKDSGRLFPNLTSKEAFHYPGALAGLAGRNDDCKVWLLVYEDKRQAKNAFKDYAKKVTSGIGIHQSSGPSYHNYKDPKAGVWGRIKRIDEIILHIEARNEEAVDQTFKQAGLITPNPRANLLTDIFQTDKYFFHIVIFILAYALIQIPIWNRVGSWAVSVYPKPGVLPVSESELRRRLLAINDLDVPFHVVERQGKKLEVVWRLADAKWVGLITANKVSRVEILRLRLSEHNKSCRAVEISKAIKTSADGTTLQFAFSFSFFRGIVFGQWEYEKQFGLIWKDGGLTFDTAYEYKFNLSELKNPVVNIVVSSGWSFKPVMFFSRILGG
jgi:hypothetical protein